jgi:hypothetical protein
VLVTDEEALDVGTIPERLGEKVSPKLLVTSTLIIGDPDVVIST